MDTSDAPISHIKISEVNQLLERPTRTFVRLTGYLEQYDAQSKTGILYSIEQQQRYEVKANFSMIDNVNLSDYNSRFDLMQVFGYLKPSCANEFHVNFSRIIKKVNLKSYYEALDLQRSYLRKNQYLNANEIFLRKH